MDVSEPKELAQARRIVAGHPGLFVERELARESGGLPVMAWSCGSDDPQAPALMVVGGVHGLERIGSELVLHSMEALAARASWDAGAKGLLAAAQVWFVPAANPAGLLAKSRCNRRGVDLMRNAPVEARGALAVAGGQRVSARLPWFRGAKGEPMEAEAAALVGLALELAAREGGLILLDCHSGYGASDGLWFPYACEAKPFEHSAHMAKLRGMLESALPWHGYRFEPQSRQYLAHGDLWDYAFMESLKAGGRPGSFLPLTLEMGSWAWVRKNPSHLFKGEGLFHPIKEHRVARVLRRHASLVDFLLSAAGSRPAWSAMGDAEECEMMRKACSWWWSAA